MYQQPLIPSLFDDTGGQGQPFNTAITSQAQHRCAGFADQVAIALCVTGQTFKIEGAAFFLPHTKQKAAH